MVGATRPDLTIVLDVPVEIGLKRVADRSAASGGAPDRFEGEAVAAHEKRRRAYLDIAAADPGRYLVVDATGSEEAVADTIWAAIGERFLARAA